MGDGAVLTARDLLDLGPRTAVDKSLSRLVQGGRVRRLGKGLYYIPRYHAVVGELAPEPDAIASALARKTASRLQPSGAHAANLLGLSTQVASKLVYATDGPSNTIKVGKQTIKLRRVSPRFMTGAGRPGGLVTQALRHLGPKNVDDSVVARLRTRLSDTDRAALATDAADAPAWIRKVVQRVAGEPG